MTPIQLKNVKKGDIFYEQGGLTWHKFEALEDCRCKGDIEIQDKFYTQYIVDVSNEYGEKTYLLHTECLPHHAKQYYFKHGHLDHQLKNYDLKEALETINMLEKLIELNMNDLWDIADQREWFHDRYQKYRKKSAQCCI